MNVMIIFGTRPEAIKLVPVIKELNKLKGKINSTVVVTGQHREMLDQVLDVFSIMPDYDFDVMRQDQTLFELTKCILPALEEILVTEKPDIALVQGDTITAFLASLAAFYLKIPVAHIEAGLRSHDKYNPFPEETNRHIISVLADLHFAPTEKARSNLLSEGISPSNIFVTGNTVIDALLSIVEKDYHFDLNFDLDERKTILVTVHRRETFGHLMENIFTAFRQLIKRNEHIQIIYPVHPNPNVQRSARRMLSGVPRIQLIEPLDYKAFVNLLARSYIVLTDSGGIQEEACSLGKPVLVLRERTERPEAVEAGTAKVVGTDIDNIVNNAELLIRDEKEYHKMSKANNLFGDGHASERIVKIIQLPFGKNSFLTSV